MKQNIIYRLIFIISFFIIGCNEIFEESLSEKNVVLYFPSSNAHLHSYNVQFWWETIEDALSYEVQIVAPSFNAITNLITDTIVKTNKLNFTLQPGKYEWRVKAMNGSSMTVFSTNSFVIDTAEISNQYVRLTEPINNYVTNKVSNVLKWNMLFGADHYRLQIDTNNLINGNSPLVNITSQSLIYNFEFPAEGHYQWRVRAENQSDSSLWSDTYIMVYDKTPPGPVVLNSPSNGHFVVKPVMLNWSVGSDADLYFLYIYKNDSTTLYNTNFPVQLNVNKYLFTLGNSGEQIYWRVKAVDKAGNSGMLSLMWSFIIQ